MMDFGKLGGRIPAMAGGRSRFNKAFGGKLANRPANNRGGARPMTAFGRTGTGPRTGGLSPVDPGGAGGMTPSNPGRGRRGGVSPANPGRDRGVRGGNRSVSSAGGGYSEPPGTWSNPGPLIDNPDAPAPYDGGRISGGVPPIDNPDAPAPYDGGRLSGGTVSSGPLDPGGAFPPAGGGFTEPPGTWSNPEMFDGGMTPAYRGNLPPFFGFTPSNPGGGMVPSNPGLGGGMTPSNPGRGGGMTPSNPGMLGRGGMTPANPGTGVPGVGVGGMNPNWIPPYRGPVIGL